DCDLSRDLHAPCSHATRTRSSVVWEPGSSVGSATMTDDQTTGAPRLAFVHIDDVKPQEVVAQMHGDRRAGVHIQFLEWSPAHMVAHTRYDPGLVLERHGHRSDAFVYILEGLVTIGDRPCPPGTLVVLEKGASFGPLIAGPDGCV